MITEDGNLATRPNARPLGDILERTKVFENADPCFPFVHFPDFRLLVRQP